MTMNTQLKETIQKWNAYKSTARNHFASCRVQGMTRKDYEQWIVAEICSESDVVKDYAMKDDGTYKTVSAVYKTFSEMAGFVGVAVNFANSHTVRYSNYLKKQGLDPKTCLAIPVKEKAVEEKAVEPTVEATTSEAVKEEIAKAKKEGVKETKEELQSILSQFEDLARLLPANSNKEFKNSFALFGKQLKVAVNG